MKHRICLALAVASVVAHSRTALAAPVKACDVMTVQAASSVFGDKLSAGREESLDMGAQRCTFDRSDSTTPGKLAFTVSDAKTMAASLHSDIPGLTRFIKQSERGQTSETIPSLGEWNSYVWDGNKEYTLAVLYRGKVLFLVCSGPKNPHPEALMVRTMRANMQKL